MIRCGTMYSRGEIVLIPIPFSDLKANKKRPVLIISNNKKNLNSEDVIVVALTSNIRGIDSEIIINNNDMADGKLITEACVRADKIYTLSQNMIDKRFGRINTNKLDKVIEKINSVIN